MRAICGEEAGDRFLVRLAPADGERFREERGCLFVVVLLLRERPQIFQGLRGAKVVLALAETGQAPFSTFDCQHKVAVDKGNFRKPQQTAGNAGIVAPRAAQIERFTIESAARPIVVLRASKPGGSQERPGANGIINPTFVVRDG